MELIVILTVAAISITTNLMAFFALRSLRSSEVELTTTLEMTDRTPLLVEEMTSSPAIPETPLPVPVLTDPPVVVDESYHAWKNRTEQPISAPPSPHGPPPKPGPMERPYGFSR